MYSGALQIALTVQRVIDRGLASGSRRDGLMIAISVAISSGGSRDRRSMAVAFA
jgi:hypothetical protein